MTETEGQWVPDFDSPEMRKILEEDERRYLSGETHVCRASSQLVKKQGVTHAHINGSKWYWKTAATIVGKKWEEIVNENRWTDKKRIKGHAHDAEFYPISGRFRTC